jgi:integrase
MKNNGKADDTIKNTSKCLKRLAKSTDLNNPEEVKQFIANLDVSNSYKKNLSIAYKKYCQYNQIKWEMPHYTPKPKLIKIPTREKLEMIISASGRTLATRLTISMETGLRPVEVCNLKVRDIDLEQRVIYPTTAKHGRPRALKISNKLQRIIQDHIIRNDLNQNDNLFNGNSDMFGQLYRIVRNRLAKKLKDPTIQTIRLYDFRHYFATNLYHKTRDILFVKQQMGHKKIETTLVYTQLLNQNGDEEYTCRATTNDNEATQLIESGFEYVMTTPNGLMQFRKRK